MQAEIANETYKNLFAKSFLFKDLCRGFLRMIALKIKPILFLKYQVIVRRGDVKRQMVYIHRGMLQVLSEEDDETPVALLQDGKIIGEVGLIMDVPSTATIRSATNSDLCILEKSDLQSVLMHYPESEYRRAMLLYNTSGIFFNLTVYLIVFVCVLTYTHPPHAH
ncbi:hypothetical protein NP493_192g03088 [Ridgeia piscesae]|uniref:Cyclic nucleotide-binding domain-containing protein n=1 Tax=Ridgeia piscesae TaxID=27915 RepID=A0AAD9P2C4_RIDPI|nr:hypothetical protein NP493_192g03088 [Ridgeia piscesae]